jgi:hypothetical protein
MVRAERGIPGGLRQPAVSPDARLLWQGDIRVCPGTDV